LEQAMNISNLNHDSFSIRCRTCGNRFEVSRRVLADPELLVEAKESIAAKHTCRAEREYSIVRVFHSPTGEGLSEYWNTSMRRLMPAQS
jgi:hypothetical protein